MPRYAREQLAYISRALYHEGFAGLANEVLWWNCKGSPRKAYPIMSKPKADMPLYINDKERHNQIIAKARMSYTTRRSNVRKKEKSQHQPGN